MAPARRAEEIHEFFFETEVGAAQVLPDIAPFVEDDAGKFVVVQAGGGTVANGLVFFRVEFGLKGAEEFIPDNENGAHVLIEIQCVGSMVHAMVRRRNKNIFHPSQLVYSFGVREDSPYLANRIHEKISMGAKPMMVMGIKNIKL